MSMEGHVPQEELITEEALKTAAKFIKDAAFKLRKGWKENIILVEAERDVALYLKTKIGTGWGDVIDTAFWRKLAYHVDQSDDLQKTIFHKIMRDKTQALQRRGVTDLKGHFGYSDEEIQKYGRR